jgi:hypothetical protein
VKLPEDFETFYERLVLGQTQTDRIQSAANTLVEFLSQNLGLRQGDDIFLQGSFPNGTAVKPDPEREGGEYDVDLVALSALASDTPEDALKTMENALKGHGTYRGMIDHDGSRPCVRIRYAEDNGSGFHVDIVPARRCSGPAPIEIPLPKKGWRESAPAEYTQWCREHGSEFARTVQMLKRWRDHNQTARQGIKSIVLQVLVRECLAYFDNDADRVTDTFLGLASKLADHPNEPPTVLNPVLPTENLADRWDFSAYQDFRRVVDEAAYIAQAALTSDDFGESRTRWRELFGRDFPGPQSGDGPLSPPSPTPGTSQRPQRAPRVEWG